MSGSDPIGEKKSFKVCGVDVEYWLYRAVVEATDSVGVTGDIYQMACGHLYMRQEKGWELGQVEVTTHPVHNHGGILAISKGKARWVVPVTIRSRRNKDKSKKAGKQCLSEEEEDSTREDVRKGESLYS
jgi:hypothetical protein